LGPVPTKSIELSTTPERAIHIEGFSRALKR